MLTVVRRVRICVLIVSAACGSSPDRFEDVSDAPGAPPCKESHVRKELTMTGIDGGQQFGSISVQLAGKRTDNVIELAELTVPALIDALEEATRTAHHMRNAGRMSLKRVYRNTGKPQILDLSPEQAQAVQEEFSRLGIDHGIERGRNGGTTIVVDAKGLQILGRALDGLEQRQRAFKREQLWDKGKAVKGQNPSHAKPEALQRGAHTPSLQRGAAPRGGRAERTESGPRRKTVKSREERKSEMRQAKKKAAQSELKGCHKAPGLSKGARSK